MKLTTLTATTLVAALGATGTAATAPATLERLDGSTIAIAEIERRVPELLEAGVVPGLSLAVVQGGEIAYVQAFGLKDSEREGAVGPETNFAGLSLSKTVFAHLVMRLVERDVLDLDRPLHTYLSKPVPEYRFYRDLAGDEGHLAITARQVLSHTTGWPNWRWFTADRRLAAIYPPGQRFSYSGEGFAYLQLVVEELTGTGLEELAQKELFGPLAMTRTSFVWHDRFEADFASDHDRFGRPLAREHHDAGGAGSLQTTARDYASFLTAVMASRRLEEATRDEMLSPQVEMKHRRMFGPEAEVATDEHRGVAWGLGWGLFSSPHGRGYFHTGNDRGSANYAVTFPDRGMAVVLLGNSQRLESLAPALVELVLGDTYSPFDFLGYVTYDEPVWEWPRRLVRDGVVAGMAYHEALGPERRAAAGIAGEEAFLRAGEDLLGHGRQAAAVDFHLLAAERFPASPGVREGLGRARLAAGDAAGAVDAFGAGLELAEEETQAAHDLAWLRAWAAAQAAPHPVSDERLRALAGDYGPRRVVFREGALHYLRAGSDTAVERRLIPISGDTFVMAELDSFRLRIESDESGRGVRAVGLYQNGETDQTERGESE